MREMLRWSRRADAGVVAALAAGTLLVGGAVLGPAGSSLGSEPCGFTLDADDFASPEAAGDALIAQVFAADLTGCSDWRVDLAGTFHLTDTLFWDFPEPLILAGPPAGNGAPARLEAVTSGAPGSDVEHRILTAEPAAAGGTVGSVTIERLILAGGSVEGVTGDDAGGAVLADVVRLVDSELIGNSADAGGAVFANEVRAERTSFVENAALNTPAQGGAIRATGDVTLVNVTFVGNAAAEGGAVWLPASATFDATFVTFRSNAASTASAGADLHRAFTGAGSVSLRGVLFGGTDAGASCGGAALPALGSGLTVDGSFTIDASCAGVTQLDAPLTFTTVPFLAGTSALPVPDGGPAAIGQVACGAGWPALDQRGVARPQGDACDAGAVERVVSVTPPPPPPPPGPETQADAQAETETESVTGGPVPTSVPAGDGACADGCDLVGTRR